MKIQDVTKPYNMWTAKIYVKQPNYVGAMDVTVTAQNQWAARILLRGMYGIKDHDITNIRRL
jgi:hypothetical protein